MRADGSHMGTGTMALLVRTHACLPRSKNAGGRLRSCLGKFEAHGKSSTGTDDKTGGKLTVAIAVQH